MTLSTGVIVTVVMPAFNAEATIHDAIVSVLGQTVSHIEILVGDDASTDRTATIIAAFGDDRIRCVRSATNIGPGATRDQLLTHARGKWIAFCDADDTWDRTRLATLLKAAGDDVNAIVFDDFMQCHDSPDGMVPWRRLRGSNAFRAHGNPTRVDTAKFFDGKRLLVQPMFSRQLLAASSARHSRDSYGEDTFFLLKLLAAGGSLIYVPEALYFYRITSGSASNNPHRYTMLRQILESCLADFSSQADAHAALQRRLARARRAELYAPFAAAVKQRRLLDALRLAVKRPYLLWELAVRAGDDIRYHAHRIRHHGVTRGSK